MEYQQQDWLSNLLASIKKQTGVPICGEEDFFWDPIKSVAILSKIAAKDDLFVNSRSKSNVPAAAPIHRSVGLALQTEQETKKKPIYNLIN